MYQGISDEDSPQVLALEIPSTRTVLPRSLVSGVPGQKLHHVVGGTKAALALDRLGRADGEEQDWKHKRGTVFQRSESIGLNGDGGAVRWTVPVWKAQQRSGLQSLWRWQMPPASPLVALWLHWPHTHSCSSQHSSSFVQDWERKENGWVFFLNVTI